MTAGATASAQPLSHFRAIDCSTDIAGGYCTKLLADAGVDVVKVEPPGGDPLRTYQASGGHERGQAVDAGGPLFRYLHAGKRSVVGAPGDEQVEALLAGADILVESYGPGRFDVDGVRARHPHLVVLSISPYGAGGPLSDRPATDFTIQAESGTLLFRGKVTRDPVQAGGRLAEFVGGLYGAPAVVIAAERARRTGAGEHIDLSLAEVMAIVGSVFGDVAHHCVGGPNSPGPPAAWRRRRSSAPKDGFVGFNTNTAIQFQNFLVLIERTDLLDDPRFAGLAGRYLHLPEWQEIIDGYMPFHEQEEIVEKAAALRIPVSPIYNGETVQTNEHLAARGVYVDGADGLPRPRRPYRFDDDPFPAPLPSPRLGEHDRAIEPRERRAPSEAPDPPGVLPLAGLKVLDITSWWVGAAATHYLALLGAEVIHVESTSHPDGMRLTGAAFGARTGGSGATCSRPRTPTSSTSPSTSVPRRARLHGAPHRVGRRGRRELLAAGDGELGPRRRGRTRDQPAGRVPPHAGDGACRTVARSRPFRADHGADERASLGHGLPRRHPADPARSRRPHGGRARRVPRSSPRCRGACRTAAACSSRRP